MHFKLLSPTPQLIKMMKLLSLFLILGLGLVSARTAAQTISLSEKQATLKQVFKAITAQAKGYEVFYNSDQVNTNLKVDAAISKVSLEEALTTVLKSTPYTYTIEGKTIVISPKPPAPQVQANADLPMAPPRVDVRGKVVNEKGEPLAGVSVLVKGTKRGTSTDENGVFELKGLSEDAVLQFKGVNIEAYETPLKGRTEFNFTAKAKVSRLEDVEITAVNTGYQTIPKERSTGSFVQIDRELINRKVSTNILDRLDGITSGLIFNRNKNAAAVESDILIRGRSTLFGQVSPLIVVDNFPYDGDISNINPNEVESITILKDASSASIWGVRSGNGVIVITTKKGKAGQTPRITFNTNVTFGNKPDQYYQSTADARTYLDFESRLYATGYYNSRIAIPYYLLAPAVDIFARRKSGQITAADSAAQIDALAGYDVRRDLDKYFYRPTVSQQYALTISGGTASNQYFLIAGYDNTQNSQVGTSQNRVTLNAKNNLIIIPNRLELNTNVAFTSSGTTLNPGAFNNTYPIYQRLVDDNGKAIPIYSAYRKSWLDTIGQGQLLDWTNRPYDELSYADDHVRLNDYRIAATLKYTINSNLDLTLLYQYQNGRSTENNLHSQDTYFTRDYITRFTQVDYSNKTITRPVPLGGILESSSSQFSSNSGRALLNYNGMVSKNGQLNVLGGIEIKDYQSFSYNRTQFGYNDVNATEVQISPVNQYATFPAGLQSQISATNNQIGKVDRYLSYFANAGYTHNRKYLANLSARKDESNLFGVNANQKGVPLWSAGLGWIASSEKWFTSNVLSYFKLRLTYGYNGNIDKSTSAYTTASAIGTSIFLQPAVSLINPPNPDLTWEKTSIINAGIDFGLFRGKVQGSVEGYYRKGSGLIGLSSVATQTGITQFRQNIADMSGKGVDVTVSATPVNRLIKWNITALYSYNTDRIDRYFLTAAGVKRYVTNINVTPYEGRSWSSVFAYKWNGLNPATGDPQGFVGGVSSVDYTKLTNPTSTDEIEYVGAGRPTHFGSIRNTFSYKRLSLSFNMTYELGFYFRRNSVNYTNVVSSTTNYGIATIVHGDLANRWQKPGDELTTNIPSFIYPVNSARDEFYTYSMALIEKGDHLRLRDIQLSYDLNLLGYKNSPVRNARLYLYANNIGILWRANKYGIDPNAVTGIPAPFAISAGVNVDFK
jgi:TonB-linked SusC/RagA family outer membrane protein